MRPKTGTTERQAAQEAQSPPAPAAGPAHVDASPAPPEGAGGAIKILGCAAQNLLCAHTQPPLFPCRRFALPLRYPVDWGGVESEKKKNTKPNPNKRFISLETERRPRPWGTLWAGRSAGMGMGCARAFFASQGWRAVLQDATPYPAPRCRASREGPGVRAILAAPLARKAGPGPLPPHARSNSGAGPPMASASPGGERATLPGARSGRWRAGPLCRDAEAATLRGQDAAASSPWMALARTDPGTAQPSRPATAEARWRSV